MTAGITLSSPAGSLPPAGHYLHSTTVGGFIFISGQLPVIFDGEKKVDASFEDQTRPVLRDIDTCLAGAGISRQHLVSVRVYMTDMNQWPTFSKIYGERIGDPRPSRAVADVAELYYGFALGVEATVLTPQA